MLFVHRYTTETDYEVIEKLPNGTERMVPMDQHDYLEWVANGNAPGVEVIGRFLSIADGKIITDPLKDVILRIESGERFLSIVDGIAVIDPNKDAILLAELKQQFVSAVQIMLDTTARTRNYDGILSACTYATSTNQTFKAEAQACVAWRDAVWSTCYTIMADVESGSRNMPSIQELLNELPALNW